VNVKRTVSVLIFFSAAGLLLRAQGAADVEALRREMQAMKEAFEKSQAESRKQIEDLTRKLDAVMRAQSKGSPTVAATNQAKPAPTPEQKKLEEELAAELGTQKASTNPPAQPQAAPLQSWSPSQPIPVLRAGAAYMNISFDALMDFGWSTARDPSKELQLGDHDPINRGFSLRNAEIAVDGAVDPYFKGFANMVFKLDKDNETEVELEEVFAQSTSLPANLQLKAGQFLAAFGRQNQQHPHAWAFVDQPLILNRVLGPEGLRNIGAQLSWLAPTPFYTEATLGVFNGAGGTAFSFRNPGENDIAGVNRYLGRATHNRDLRGAEDLLFVPRLASSFDLTDEQTLLVGGSAGFGPNNTGESTRSEIYGLDAYWKWKPADASKGFPFVSWQTEAMYRRFEAGADPSAALRSEIVRDYGFYSQVLWGFTPGWVVGLRGEWVTGNDTAVDAMDIYRGDRVRISPVLTWYPTEFSKIRLQYNYDDGDHFGDQHSVWLQLEFTLGAHAAHKY
jgi:hypothetical protein